MDKKIIELLVTNLPIERYGKGGAKSFASLFEQILQGECEIKTQLDGSPLRVVNVIRIKCRDQSGKYLHEIYQEWISRARKGERKVRNYNGVSEKLRAGESPIEGRIRALEEELGIAADDSMKLNFTESLNPTIETKESESLPGLCSQYLFWDYEVFIPQSLWQAQYVELTKDKKTVFEWR